MYLDTLANKLFCESCQEIISLKDSNKSILVEAVIIFTIIICRKCFLLKRVPTDKPHMTSTNKLDYDLDTKLAFSKYFTNNISSIFVDLQHA